MRFPCCVVVVVLVFSNRSLSKGRIIWVTVRLRSNVEKESKGG